jgi:hypothetical protein
VSAHKGLADRDSDPLNAASGLTWRSGARMGYMGGLVCLGVPNVGSPK